MKMVYFIELDRVTFSFYFVLVSNYILTETFDSILSALGFMSLVGNTLFSFDF